MNFQKMKKFFYSLKIVRINMLRPGSKSSSRIKRIPLQPNSPDRKRKFNEIEIKEEIPSSDTEQYLQSPKNINVHSSREFHESDLNSSFEEENEEISENEENVTYLHQNINLDERDKELASRLKGKGKSKYVIY